MTLDRAKPLLLPISALLAFEGWARATHLQSDSLAPPSEIVAALAGALADHSILAATREHPEFLRLRRQLFDFIRATEQ